MLFAPDRHLDVQSMRKLNAIEGDSMISFSAVVDLCISLGQPLILGGDNFNSKVGDAVVQVFFVKQMARMKEAGLAVYSIQGQHCAVTKPWTEVTQYVQWIGNGVPIIIGGRKVAAYDHMSSPEHIKEILDKLDPEVEILIMHQMLKEAMSFDEAWNMCFEWIPQTVKFALLGDYHSCDPTAYGKLPKMVGMYSGANAPWFTPSRGPVAIYGGSGSLRAFDEHPQKYCVELTGDKWRFHELPTRSFYRAIVRNDTEVAQAIEEIHSMLKTNDERVAASLIPAEIALPLVCVEKSPAVVYIKEKLTEAFGERICFYVKNKPGLLYENMTKEELEMGDVEDINLADFVSKVVDPDESPLLFKMVSQLLEQETITARRQVLTSIKEELQIS